MLRHLGYGLDVRRPRLGDLLPQTMQGHAGAVIFGGPMSANDSEPFIATEIQWIDVVLRAGSPFLGICLGAQMLAKALGQRVDPHPDHHVEMGYYPIWPTSEGDAATSVPFPRWVYHWHSEGFSLPGGTTCLARGEDFECQAFRHGANAVGLQFHPEVTYAMICRWSVLGAGKLVAPKALPPHQHRESWFIHDRAVERWTKAFLADWVKHPKGSPKADSAAPDRAESLSPADGGPVSCLADLGA